MKKDVIISSILLFAISITIGISCTESFYCNPRLIFPLFFIVMACSSYYGSYYIQDTTDKRQKVLRVFLIPFIILLLTFMGITAGYVLTTHRNDNFIEFFQYKDSFFYLTNIFLLLVSLSIINWTIYDKRVCRIILSFAIPILISGLYMFLYFNNPLIISSSITSTITTIIEIIITAIGVIAITVKK